MTRSPFLPVQNFNYRSIIELDTELVEVRVVSVAHKKLKVKNPEGTRDEWILLY